MNKSTELNELFAAHSQFLGRVRNIFKGAQAHKYKYAKLPDVLDLVNPLLSEQGLSITQWIERSSDMVSVRTVLGHKSGQWMESTIEMMVEKNASMSVAQAVGSISTYARRYSILAVCNISGSDDDNDAHISDPQPVVTPKSSPWLDKLVDLMKDNAVKDYVLTVLDKRGMGMKDLNEDHIKVLLHKIEEGSHVKSTA